MDAPKQPTPTLTPREREVITAYATGKTSQQIADSFFVSKRTIDFHVANAYRKLGVKNKIQAYMAAQRLGMIAPVPATKGSES